MTTHYLMTSFKMSKGQPEDNFYITRKAVIKLYKTLQKDTSTSRTIGFYLFKSKRKTK